MKNLLYLLILISFSAGAIAGVDIDSFCKANIDANSQRAQWGLDLRQTMLQNCVDQNLRICSKPYTDSIIRQEQLDEASLSDSFQVRQPSATIRFLMQTATREKTTAAYMALRGVDPTAQQIAEQIYRDCVAQTAQDLAAATSTPTYAPNIAPVCSNYAGSDDLYRQRCCTPDCYCDVYCQ